MQDNVTATEYHYDSCESTVVLNKKADILYSSVTQ